MEILCRCGGHYGAALARRAGLLQEIARLRRAGVALPPGLGRQALRRPSAAEDVVNLLRFLDPAEAYYLVDVGANVGAWTRDFLRAFPHTVPVLVEPQAAVQPHLTALAAEIAGAVVHQVGASDHAGVATMHVGGDHTLSSLERYAPAAAAGRDEGHDRQSVRLARLDDLVLDPAFDGQQRVVVVKIDVQGHEVAAVAGMTRLLARAEAVLVELSFVPEYEGMEPSFAPVTAAMLQAGLHPVVFQEAGRVAASYPVERDVLYVRAARLNRIWHDWRPAPPAAEAPAGRTGGA